MGLMLVGSKYSMLWRPLLFAPGLLFEGLVRARNKMYDASLLPQVRLPHPVISIGNLTVGGSGKTPLVIYVAQMVSRLGGIPVLLSRGYGTALKAPVILPPGESVSFPAQVLGDEPALVRRHEARLWLGISPDRHAAGLRISQVGTPMVFILDDGFQHRRLKRDLDLLVVDRMQPLAQNRMAPLGTLREPLAGLRRADLVVINGRYKNGDYDPLEAAIREIKPNGVIFHCAQQIERLVPFAEWQGKSPAAGLSRDTKAAFLVAAIGNPERFRRDVQALGIEIKGTRFFRDHFRLRAGDWLSCTREARASGAGALITTEKDAIKLSDALDFPLFVAVQSTRLTEQSQLEQMLATMIEGHK
jgi:tetraacyldisaccharide 4'-kinase